MKPSIGSLLADVARTQSAYEAAKDALYLAKFDAQLYVAKQRGEVRSEWSDDVAKEFGDYRTNDEMAAHYCVENGISWEDRNK
jgi:hypothetical protein